MCQYCLCRVYPLQGNLGIYSPIEQVSTILQKTVNIPPLPIQMMLWPPTTNYQGCAASPSLLVCLGSGTLAGSPGTQISYSPTIGGAWGHAKTMLTTVAVAAHTPALRPL